ncbi:MAG: Inositol 2-dehydrogenase [Candidatus Hydrogenedentota bacterium]|jgi:predicted dehydrogenase
MNAARTTRRFFLGGVAAGLLTPAVARALKRGTPANERIQLGFIGLGGMGRSHLDRLFSHPEVRIIAGADPDARMRKGAANKAKEAGGLLAVYPRYQEMLAAHPDIDAVFVATPDHWHALAAIDAMRAGMDVYCEKPLALTIAQGRAMVAEARRLGRVVQVGTMQRSDQPQFRHACELVRNGRIGEVKRVVCFFKENPREEYHPDTEPPAYLDWDYWLGPAPRRAFNPQIHPYNWRYFRDYSGGLLTDWGVHLFDIAQWGLDKDATSPIQVTANSALHADNLYDFPRFAHIIYQYADNAVIEWHQATREAVDGVIEAGETYGTKFYGSEGEVFVNRSGIKVRGKDGAAVDENLEGAAIRLPVSNSHHQDFFDAMRSRRRPLCDVETGHRATVISHLGGIASQLGRPLRYDPDAERFTGDPVANRLLDRPMRSPWRL